MRPIPSAAAVSALLLLAACATSPNPAEGGFFSGVKGLVSGDYDRRVNEQSDELKQMQAQEAAAEAAASEANAALAERERSLEALRKEVAELDSSVKRARAEAAKRDSNNAALSAKNRQLMSDLETTQKRLTTLQDQLRSNTSAADYDAASKQYQDLKATLDALTDQLSGSER